ncbi:MAG: sigma factor-like helix-turn-helix DNA-binding protein [Bacteroidota bacterium]
MPERARNMLEQMIQQDELAPIKRALTSLGESCRRIIWEREYYGYSLEEISHRLGFSSVKSVSSKKANCLKRLRALLSERKKT